MSTDHTPRFVPEIERRRPDPLPEPVHLDPEAARAAMDASDRAHQGGVGFRSAVLIGVMTFLGKVREASRRGPRYRIESTGVVLDGVNVADVHEALSTLQKWGGDEGPQAEDAMARAIEAVDRARERRAQGRQHRHQDPRVAEMVDQVAHRVAIHRTVVSGAQR